MENVKITQNIHILDIDFLKYGTLWKNLVFLFGISDPKIVKTHTGLQSQKISFILFYFRYQIDMDIYKVQDDHIM